MYVFHYIVLYFQANIFIIFLSNIDPLVILIISKTHINRNKREKISKYMKI